MSTSAFATPVAGYIILSSLVRRTRVSLRIACSSVLPGLPAMANSCRHRPKRVSTVPLLRGPLRSLPVPPATLFSPTRQRSLYDSPRSRCSATGTVLLKPPLPGRFLHRIGDPRDDPACPETRCDQPCAGLP